MVKRSGYDVQIFADVFVKREAVERLQTSGTVVGVQEIREVAAKLIVAVVVIALHRRLLDGAVHPLNRPVGPKVVRLGQLACPRRPVGQAPRRRAVGFPLDGRCRPC